MNVPTNKPTGHRLPLGLSRRPFAVVARISLLAVVVAVLGACGAQQGTGNQASPSDPAATEEQAAANPEEDRGGTAEASAPATDDVLGPPILGDEDAPVAMVEHADYQ